MSILHKIFGTAPQTSPQPQQPITNNPANNPTPQGTAQSPGTAPNGVIPDNPALITEQKPVSPLAEFEELWQSTPTDPNAPSPEPTITPQQMMEAAAKVDFSKVISQEDLTKIAAGGTEAQGAFISAMNKVAQASYGQSTVVTQKLVKLAVDKAREEFVAQLPALVKKQALGELNFNENPALNNPVVAPIISAIESQLIEKFPTASAAELNSMAKKIMSGAADLFTPKQKTEPQPKGKSTPDWEKWLTS